MNKLLTLAIAHIKGTSGLTHAMFTQPFDKALKDSSLADKRQLISVLSKTLKDSQDIDTIRTASAVRDMTLRALR